MSDHDPKSEEAQLIQAVHGGAVDVDDVSIAGFAELDAAKATQLDAKEKKERERDLVLQIRSTNEFLKRLEAQIAKAEAAIILLREQYDAALFEATEAFDKMHEAEYLLEAIKDGISDDERKRLVELLGSEAENASVKELVILLQRKIDQEHDAGLAKSAEAEEAAKDIADKEAKIRTWEAEVKAYENAPSAEHREAIESKLVSGDAENRETERATDIEFNALSFR